MQMFPVNSTESLKELDSILAKTPTPYVRTLRNKILSKNSKYFIFKFLQMQQMRSLFGGNAEKNLHHVLGRDIILNFNVDGINGKQRLRNFRYVLKALTGMKNIKFEFAGKRLIKKHFYFLLDVLSSFSSTPDKTLRSAFQRQKKKFLKETSRSKKRNENLKTSDENGDKIMSDEHEKDKNNNDDYYDEDNDNFEAVEFLDSENWIVYKFFFYVYLLFSYEFM